MPATTIDLQQTDDKRDVIHRSVELLSAGKIIALPTETVYGLAVSALHPEAVERLADLKGRSPDKPFAVAVKSLNDAEDYVPNMPPLAQKIARRSWPGPATLVLDATHPDSVIQRLASSVQAVTVPHGTIGLRNPAHDVTLEIMKLCAGPILLTSANHPGEPPATDGQQVVDTLADQVDLILNDGPCHFGEASSVIRVEGTTFDMLRTGVLDQAAIERLTGFMALVVCTGNTCRSPMAEGMLKKRLAEKIGCSEDELVDKGVSVLSAGIAAMPGSPAAQQAIKVMDSMGIDINAHASRPVTNQLAEFADVILTLSNGHRNALVSHWPNLEPYVHTLRRDRGDVSDPIGSPVEVYAACAQQIDENLKDWVEDFDLPVD